MLWNAYTENFREFYAQYLENQEKYGNNHGFLGRPELPPPNAYTVSCLPWISFQHFSVHSENSEYYFPSVEAGKFIETDGKILLPLSVTCHHAATDGYHIHTFLKSLQDSMNDFGKYL